MAKNISKIILLIKIKTNKQTHIHKKNKSKKLKKIQSKIKNI